MRAVGRSGRGGLSGNDDPVANGRDSYSVEELAELASGLRRLLHAIETGELEADAGTISGLEGAWAAIEALAKARDP